MRKKRSLWRTVAIAVILLIFVKYAAADTGNEIAISPEAVSVEYTDTGKSVEEFYMTAVRTYGAITVLSAGILLIANRKKEY